MDKTENKGYMLTTSLVRSLCIRENYFTAGTNTQYDKMFSMVEEGKPLDDIALAIWLCSNDVPLEDIKKNLENKAIVKEVDDYIEEDI